MPENPQPPPPATAGETDDGGAADAPPVDDDGAAKRADAFARGGALREKYGYSVVQPLAADVQPDGAWISEVHVPSPALAADGELPERIRSRLLSDNPDMRQAGRRLQLLEHVDGGAAGRGLSLRERAQFMQG